jgi:hypothetical protein
MIPGSVSKVVEGSPVASAATITPRMGEVFRVTGSTAINTINPPLGIMQNQVIYLIPTDGAVTLGTSGNINAGVAMAQNRVVMLVWLKATQKWYIENGA